MIYRIIYNPVAGRSLGKKLTGYSSAFNVDKVCLALEREKHQVITQATEKAGDAEGDFWNAKELAIDAVHQAKNFGRKYCIAVAGGDGTISQVVDGILSTGGF